MWAPIRRHLDSRRAMADHYVNEAARFVERARARLPNFPAVRILEIGCGQTCAWALVMSTLVDVVIAIDSEPGGPRRSLRHWRRSLAIHGGLATAKRMLRHATSDRGFYRRLALSAQERFGTRLSGRADVREMDASALALADHSIDTIYSEAVFEHIADVAGAAREMARVLRPGGFAELVIHLYPSLSGGHHPDWQAPDTAPSRRVPPWDHLLDRRFPVADFCNGWRESDYLAAFTPLFVVAANDALFEGEGRLDEDILRRLPGYSRQDLLKRAIRLILTPRPAGV
ncbi:MAG: methyltransferase domain-containing protein [Planctomycetes bacterium]|nr:methyltransferase domain-containing protein [Planctomycetota bacterium]